MNAKTNMPEDFTSVLSIAHQAGNDLVSAEAKKGTGTSRSVFACVEAFRLNISERLTMAIGGLIDTTAPQDDKTLNAWRKMVIAVDLFGIGEIHTDDNGKSTHKILNKSGNKDEAATRKWGAIWNRVNASIPLIGALIASGRANVEAGKPFDADYELSASGYLSVRASAMMKPGTLKDETDLGDKTRTEAYAKMMQIGKPGGSDREHGRPSSMDQAIKAAREVTGIKRGGSGNGAKGAQATGDSERKVQTTLEAAANMLAHVDPGFKDKKLSKEQEVHARACLAHLLRYFGAAKDGKVEAEKVEAALAAGANG